MRNFRVSGSKLVKIFQVDRKGVQTICGSVIVIILYVLGSVQMVCEPIHDSKELLVALDASKPSHNENEMSHAS